MGAFVVGTRCSIIDVRISRQLDCATSSKPFPGPSWKFLAAFLEADVDRFGRVAQVSSMMR
jgi:hypothetical protein